MTSQNRIALSTLALALLGACAAPKAPSSPVASPPAQWQAPLPHDGRIAELGAWWAQFDDPLLARLVESAQAASPSVASARARIEQARAAQVAAGAALVPSVQAETNASRGRSDLSMPLATRGSAALQASWELDVFGAHRAGADSAQARVDAAQTRWHDARVSVAAEVAAQYVALRACEAQVLQSQADAASRSETARLTGLTARSGLQSRADNELANASAAQARAGVVQQRSQCELDVKALVFLTGIAEPELRTALAANAARVPQPATIDVPAVPAQAIAQRPDLAAAERDVSAAAADVVQSQARGWPRIALGGSIGRGHLDAGDARCVTASATCSWCRPTAACASSRCARAAARASASRCSAASSPARASSTAAPASSPMGTS